MNKLLTLLWTLSLLAPAGAAAPTSPGWSSLREAPFTFHYRDRDAGVAERLAAESGAVVEDLRERTGLALPRVVDVILAPDPATFAGVQPSAPPAWAAGTAWSERGEIYLRTRMPHSGRDPLLTTFTHEVVHIAVGGAFVDPPRWLNEGLAKVLSHEWDARSHALLARATLGGSLLPLEDITTRWPSGAGRAQLAYAQATDFVSFLSNQGEGALPDLIRRLSAGEPLDDALRGATGQDLATLEGRWRGRITFWHALLPVIGSSGALWGLTSILFLVAAWRQRRRFKRQLAALEERERALLAAVPVPLADAWQGEGMMLRPPTDEEGEVILH